MRSVHDAVTGLVVVTTAAVFVAGCGVPQSGEFEAISRDDIQFDLNATTTTSSSTVPPTTLDVTTTTEAAPTTTISTEDVLLYFVSGSQLTSVTQALARPATPSQVLAQLLKGPPSGDIGTGLRSTIPDGAALTVERANGVGIIDLPTNIFDAMPSRDQRLFFAQLVLTIGRLGGIGPVQFTRAGEPASVIRGDGTTTAPGDFVTVDDYAVLLTGSPSVVASITEDGTTTTTTTTTVGG
jgi:hypothetical protein